MRRIFFRVICYLILGIVVSSYLFSESNEPIVRDEFTDIRLSLITYSKRFVGVPYLHGGASVDGMDSSGLVFTVVNDVIGVKLPRSVSAIYSVVRMIDDSKKLPGDLLFFKTAGSKISHVGIYLGSNQFIHSASTGSNTGVIVSSLMETYWNGAYVSAGRFLD